MPLVLLLFHWGDSVQVEQGVSLMTGQPRGAVSPGFTRVAGMSGVTPFLLKAEGVHSAMDPAPTPPVPCPSQLPVP